MTALTQRVLTALGAGALLLAVILGLPKDYEGVALGIFALVVLIGAWEWSAFIRFRSQVSRFVYVILIAAVMAVMQNNTRKAGDLDWFLWITAAWWAVAFLWIAFRPAAHNRITVIVCGFFVLVPAWVCLAHIFRGPDGPYRVLFLLILVFAADIGA